MADDDEAEEEPAVELGAGEAVSGAPIARVSSRLTWPKEKSAVVELEGDAEIRTPDGPRRLADVLEDVETTYFDRRQQFESDVRDVVGEGAVATE